MVSKSYHKREASKSLVSYELSSDEYDFDADQFVVSETESNLKLFAHHKDSKGSKEECHHEKLEIQKDQKLRYECKPHPTKAGIKPAKTPKPDCSKYRLNVGTQNFSKDDRYELCKTYWALEAYKHQNDFIIEYVKTETPKRRKVGARKQTNQILFSIVSHNSDIKKIPVAGRGRPHVQLIVLKPLILNNCKLLNKKKRHFVTLVLS